MKKYNFLQESIGRDLVGASRFASRKSVTASIIQQYPDPQALADKLQQMAEQSYGKEKETILNLSLQCRGLDQSQYPKFVNKISGFSKIWKYIGIGAATAGAVAAANYAINKGDEYLQNTDSKNVSLKGALKHIGKSAVNDANNLAKSTATAIGKVPGAQYLKKIPGAQSVNNYMKSGQAVSRAIGSSRNAVNNAVNKSSNAINNLLRNRATNLQGNNPVKAPVTNPVIPQNTSYSFTNPYANYFQPNINAVQTPAVNPYQRLYYR